MPQKTNPKKTSEKLSDIKVDGLTIGSKVFVIHRDYISPGRHGGIIRSARVTGFKNNNGNLELLFKIVGVKDEMGMNTYIPYIDIKVALLALTR